MKFIVDHNVGKLTRWLRMMGYDTLFFTGEDDRQMIITALNEGRVILTRDTQVMARGVVANGKIRALLIRSDKQEEQISQVVEELKLDTERDLFSRCLECNSLLEPRAKQEVEGRVPEHVFKTQERFFECPGCHRIYWQGTHWQAMRQKLAGLTKD